MSATPNPDEVTAELALNRVLRWIDRPRDTSAWLWIGGRADSGRTALLREVVARHPTAAQFDCAGRSAEEVARDGATALGIAATDSFKGNFAAVASRISDDPVVVLANTQWAGRLRTSREPERVLDQVARALIEHHRRGLRMRLLVEVDDAPGRAAELGGRHLTLQGGFEGMPALAESDEDAALSSVLRALALAEHRFVPVSVWSLLCSALGRDVPESRLESLLGDAAAGDWIHRTDDGAGAPVVSFKQEAMARQLRTELSAEEARSCHARAVTALSATDASEATRWYAGHALAGHAAAAGRFEAFLKAVAAVAGVGHESLFEAFEAVFHELPIPQGSAGPASITWRRGVRPSSQGEWLALLHLTLIQAGPTEEAAADRLLTAAGPVALPWRTLWAEGIGAGAFSTDTLVRRPVVRTLQIVHTPTGDLVTARTRRDHIGTWDLATGAPRPEPGEPTDSSGTTQADQGPQGWRPAGADGGEVDLPRMPEYIRRGVRSGRLIALASTDGVCVVEINESAGQETAPGLLKCLVGTGTKLAPADLPAAALAPTTDWLTDVWGAAAVTRFPQETLPAALSDIGARVPLHDRLPLCHQLPRTRHHLPCEHGPAPRCRGRRQAGRGGVHVLLPRQLAEPEPHPARPRPRRRPVSPNSLPPRQRTAMTALALSEPHRVRFEEWQALCSALGADFDLAELRAIGEESPFITVEPTDELPVGFTHERDARRLRDEVPVETFQAFQQAVVDLLFAGTYGDSLDDYLTRALPAHAVTAGRFEELLADPRTLVKCTHTALLNALRVAFPDSIPAGSFAADLYYLNNLGLAPSSQAEWVSLLHLVALSQGDTERADALIESAGPLPWRTVWTHWRAPGRVRPCPPQIDVVEELQAEADGTTVTSRTTDRLKQTWHAATGRLLAATGQFIVAKGPFIEEAPPTPQAPARWGAETSWNLARAAAVGDPSTLRVIQAPKVKDVACAGDLVVLGGSRGIYAIEPDPDYIEANPLPALPAISRYAKVTPRPFDEAACRPTRDLVLDVFDADIAPLLTEEELPAGLTHEPTRRFLTEVGFPAVNDFLSLSTHNLAGTGFAEHTWAGTKEFETPVGDGPFYELGTWIGGIPLLDGPTGRVLRQSRKGAVDDDRPGDPLAGSSLAQFSAMVCLQWKYMLAYHTSGGLDGEDLIDELRFWLAGIDPAAAATRNWGHVTDTDQFIYLWASIGLGTAGPARQPRPVPAHLARPPR